MRVYSKHPAIEETPRSVRVGLLVGLIVAAALVAPAVAPDGATAGSAWGRSHGIQNCDVDDKPFSGFNYYNPETGYAYASTNALNTACKRVHVTMWGGNGVYGGSTCIGQRWIFNRTDYDGYVNKGTYRDLDYFRDGPYGTQFGGCTVHRANTSSIALRMNLN